MAPVNDCQRTMTELRHQVAQLPSFAEITDRVEASLNTPTSTVPADTPVVTMSWSARPSNFSPTSARLSKADSGFGSPPFRVPDDGNQSNRVGDISGVVLDGRFGDDDEAAPSVSIQDGKALIEQFLNGTSAHNRLFSAMKLL